MSQPAICPIETPFFIVGNPRSGTTLLAVIVSSHPRLHTPGETGFLPRLTKYAQGELSQEQIGEIIKIALQNRDWKGVMADEKRFYDTLPSKTLVCVLDGLYRLRAKDFKAERWGDKTPSYVRYIPEINQIFPEAQFIHIIRDGRDAALSAQQRWGKQKWYMDNYYLLKNWSFNVQVGRAAGRKLGPKRYLEIKYETLVQEPYETVQQICAFLQEDFHPDMLEHSKLAQQVITPAGHTEVLRPINTRSVDRWKLEMTSFDKKMANKLIGEMLTSCDYPLAESRSMSIWERTKVFGLGVRFQFLHLMREVLYTTGLLTLNRRKKTG